MIKYSILIPNLGYSDFLEQCFDSVLTQSFLNEENFEIIICDQSEQAIFLKIKEYIRHYSFNNVKFLHNEEKSIPLARHALINAACGEYIVFIDSDDTIDVDHFDLIDKAIKKNLSPDILIFGFNIIDESNKFVSKNIPDNFENPKDQFYFEGNFTNLWRKVFKRTLYQKDKYTDFKTTFGDDWIFSKNIFDAAKTIVIEPSICSYNYRLNSNSITHNFTIEQAFEAINHRDPYLPKARTFNQQNLFIKSKFLQFIYVSKIIIFRKMMNYKKYKLFFDSARKGLSIHKNNKWNYSSTGEKIFFRLFRKNNAFALWFLLIVINKKTKRKS